MNDLQTALPGLGHPLLAVSEERRVRPRTGGVTTALATEKELAGAALALGARDVGPWSDAEHALAEGAEAVSRALTAKLRELIVAGGDPLGDAFCALRSPVERRSRGATYTPLILVKAMLKWAARQGSPERVVDPGAGSGRFVVNAGRVFEKAKLVAIELDPLAAMLARAHLAVSGLQARSRVLAADYRAVSMPSIAGRTLFVGNPPYVRHHDVQQKWKDWLTRAAAARGLSASQLAGLHVHFFLATLEHSRPGDWGAYVTAAEWLDVNYGSLVRALFVGALGGSALHVIEPSAVPFPDAAATAVISCFRVGERSDSIRVKRVATPEDLGELNNGRPVRRERLATASRWTPLTRNGHRTTAGLIELGELCRVHRGQVTGSNHCWIVDGDAGGLPASVLFPTVTRARELYRAGRFLTDSLRLRRVIDLPENLDLFQGEERKRIDELLRRARAAGVHLGYIASHRRPWWSVGLHDPAPILATYMARRPPGFVRNLSGARHINIAHGIYPRDPLTDGQLTALADYLATHTSVAEGRTYAGGLTKFEPKEMERLLVPPPELLK